MQRSPRTRAARPTSPCSAASAASTRCSDMTRSSRGSPPCRARSGDCNSATSCYWLSGQLLNMGLILKPDFPHHSPQTSDIHRHALASNMEAGGWCGNIYHNIPFKYRHSPLLRLNILSQFSCPPVKLYSGAVCV